MMKNIYRNLRFCTIVAFAFIAVNASAQQIITDRNWYLAGETMTVAVEVGEAEKTSKVAYVELCDANGLQVSAVIGLTNGRGQGIISLPSTMHSGYYQLSMYTRMGSQALQKMVPVVNVLQKSADDDINWVETSAGSFANGATTSTSFVDLPASYTSLYGQRAENEGHCIYARIHRAEGNREYLPSQIETSLAVVGKTPHLFDGKILNDSTAVFNTYDVEGRHSIVLTAQTYDMKPLPVEIINPFATLVPQQLPHLTYNYNRAEVEQRSLQMQQSVADTLVVDSTTYTKQIFSTEPIFSYNLDDYRQFHTIREVLLEYVVFVHKTQKYGRTQLYIYNEQDGFSDWPALVLLDGMPVQDIDRLMKYDARRVHYISVFDDHYTFGHMTYKGILNIVTRTGKLTNFPPEKTSAYLIYDFPQNDTNK